MCIYMVFNLGVFFYEFAMYFLFEIIFHKFIIILFVNSVFILIIELFIFFIC